LICESLCLIDSTGVSPWLLDAFFAMVLSGRQTANRSRRASPLLFRTPPSRTCAMMSNLDAHAPTT
jgi:hypothetical protein